MPRERILIIFLVILSGVLAASAVNPYDRATWFMEVAPVLIVVPILRRWGQVYIVSLLNLIADNGTNRVASCILIFAILSTKRVRSFVMVFVF
jgi:hypothetical protein